MRKLIWLRASFSLKRKSFPKGSSNHAPAAATAVPWGFLKGWGSRWPKDGPVSPFASTGKILCSRYGEVYQTNGQGRKPKYHTDWVGTGRWLRWLGSVQFSVTLKGCGRIKPSSVGTAYWCLQSEKSPTSWSSLILTHHKRSNRGLPTIGKLWCQWGHLVTSDCTQATLPASFQMSAGLFPSSSLVFGGTKVKWSPAEFCPLMCSGEESVTCNSPACIWKLDLSNGWLMI